MDASAVALLQTTDWNEEWKRLQAVRKRADDVTFWNRRAHTYGSETPGAYAVQFMDLAGVLPGESIFDMGCGSGNLALPYAQAGHHVLAADFSDAMLEKTRHAAREAGVANVETKLLSWQEDWQAAGIGPKAADVAIASRSIATEDLKEALGKLEHVARRRCCITLSTSSSPHVDDTVLRECGIPNNHGRDFQYAMNILINEGRLPTCSYIKSERKDTFDSLEDACAQLDRMVQAALDEGDDAGVEEARARLRCWLESNLVPNEEAGLGDGHHGVQKALRLSRNRQFVWAFIAWDVEG